MQVRQEGTRLEVLDHYKSGARKGRKRRLACVKLLGDAHAKAHGR